ncbi:MAG: phytoene/squalene synthase family protein [Myxococcales bacterium]|nr:phytoene/squalene synthase family protein [Myxococcales bacterium]
MNDRAAIVAESRAVLSRHARSFRLAAAFLPAERHDDAAVVYAFCRAVDDAVDDAPDEATARAALAELEAGLDGQSATRTPITAALVALAARCDLPLDAARQLIAGVRGDLTPARVPDDDALVRYGYLVAGTVGRLMCGVLEVRDPAAEAHAIDLGVAMQITNICRDVAEDARLGRIYLPADRLAVVGITPEALLAGEAAPAAVSQVVRELLALAERYYASAEVGMRYIPRRPRLAIFVAARVYRAIGRRLLRRHGGNPLFGRCVVPPLSKLVQVIAAAGRWIQSLGRAPSAHDPALHAPLRGLAPSLSLLLV